MTRPSCLDRPCTILFTSAGNEALHGFIDDLRRRAPRWVLVGVDVREDAAGAWRCDVARVVPRRDDSRFLPTLRAICDELAVDVVVPLSTRDQDHFAEPAVQQAIGRRVLVSSARAVAAANAKVALFRALAGRPELLGPSEVVHDPATALAAARRLLGVAGAVVVKEDLGTGGAGMLFVGEPVADAAPAEGRRFLQLDALPAALQGPDGAPRGTWPRLVCAWLPGQEYSVDVLARDGAVLGGVVRLRHRAIGGLATLAETVDAPDVWSAAQEVVGALSLSWVNNIQFRRDGHGVPRLLEVNPRIPGTISLTVESGLNLPLAAICLALGDPMDVPAPELGVHVSRFAGSTFRRSGQALPAPSATLVDLDGTLVHLRIPREAISAWKRHLRARLDPVLGPEGLSPLLPTLESALARLPSTLGPAEGLRLRHALFADLDAAELDACTSIDPIDTVLRAVLPRGGPMALVTNNGRPIVLRALDVIAGRARELGLPPPAFVVVHRSPDLPAKPSPVPLQVALDRLQALSASPLRSALLVGDSDADEGAVRALRPRVPHPVHFVRVGPEGQGLPLPATA
jgi:carbamoyl-phosphate synthase large subunit